MHTFINSPLTLGTLTLPHRLIQGPLAGYSCAPFRVLFHHFKAPAYCVSEMISAWDILHKHTPQSRYLYRAPEERRLAYQLAGTEPDILTEAALQLQTLGADIIDINCGCPKSKIRTKGAGSALLEKPEQIFKIVTRVRQHISIPLTVKIRIQGAKEDLFLAQQIEAAGADALIVHGRRWTEDYDVPCDLARIAHIKKSVSIPVIANGDIHSRESLHKAIERTGCDGFMIARAGCGRPWLFKELLEQEPCAPNYLEKTQLFMRHLQELAALEDTYKAVLQSKSLVRYYFKNQFTPQQLQHFYECTTLSEIQDVLTHHASAAIHA